MKLGLDQDLDGLNDLKLKLKTRRRSVYVFEVPFSRVVPIDPILYGQWIVYLDSNRLAGDS